MKEIFNYILSGLKNATILLCNGDTVQANEVLHIATIRMWKNYSDKPLEEQKKLAHTIINNIHTDMWRKNKVKITDGLDEISSPIFDISSECKEILNFLNTEQDEQIKALNMYVEGYKVREIADYFNVPLNTISARIRYARKTIKQQFLIESKK